MDYYAHIRSDPDGKEVNQLLNDHCYHTGIIAEESLQRLGLGSLARLAGILHDMGKYKKEFQEYLACAARGEKVTKGSIIHSFAGVRYVLNKYHHSKGETAEDIMAELVAFAIGAHHGAFDLENQTGDNGFLYRIQKKQIFYQECKENFILDCVDEEGLDKIARRATLETENVVHNIVNISRNEIELGFYMGMLQRLLLSSVIEGDRQDTEAFMLKKERMKKVSPDWKKILMNVEMKISELPKKTEIDNARSIISDKCKRFSENTAKVVRLNIPTGGGKTLSSFRFALSYAEKHNKQSIILVSPLLSILEQNAEVIRSFVNDDSLILEHHSNIISNDRNQEAQYINDSYADNWSAPIIITTMVQFLNTLFSGKPACVRRCHSLVDSVIIIDEVQTVPIKMLSLFNLAINFFTEICGATVILCSATQPCLEEIEYSLFRTPKDMVPYDKRVWKIFERTEIRYAGKYLLKEVPLYAISVLKSVNSLLIICNKKSEAEVIFEELTKTINNCFHISASMCMEHRRKTLSELYECLQIADVLNPVVCVSTQVIEAGVDISFGSVIRLSAGMDNIIQSAGRCNRNAEKLGVAPVFIVDVIDENLSRLPEIKNGKDATAELLLRFKENPQMFQNSLESDASIAQYYRSLFNHQPRGIMNYSISSLDCNLLDLLSINMKYRKNDNGYYMNQAFKTAGNLFCVFEEDSIDVIVPYGEGAELIDELEQCTNYEYEKRKQLIQKVKPYTISIYRYQQEILEQEQGLRWIGDREIAYIEREYYLDTIGFTINRQTMEFMEV